MCDCRSYNADVPGKALESGAMGVPEVELDPRRYFADATKTVCVDACLAGLITALWQAGVRTYGCCCGHNGRFPAHVIVQDGQVTLAVAVLQDMRPDHGLMVIPCGRFSSNEAGS